MRVRIRGLKSQTYMNGQAGVLLFFKDDERKWAVLRDVVPRDDNGQPFAEEADGNLMRAQNLLVLAPATDEAAVRGLFDYNWEYVGREHTPLP